MNDQSKTFEYHIRITLTGDSSVGKSNLLSQYSRNEFDSKIGPTLGIDFFNQERVLNNKQIHVQITDTAG